MNSDESKECYNVIASQIDREDSLTNNRLTWTLTLNGFLFAALGFLGSKGGLEPNYWIFRWGLPLIGFVVSVAGLLGVTAAFIQITYLTKKWRELDDDRWPRPFGGKRLAFWLGAAPCFLPTAILIYVWARLLYDAW